MITKTEIEIVKPFIKVAETTGQLSSETVKEILSILIFSLKNKISSPPKLMKRHEVSEYLGVSAVQVDRLAKAGLIRKLSIGTHTTRFSELDIIRFALGESFPEGGAA